MSSPFFWTILSISSRATITTRFSSSSFSRRRLYTRSVERPVKGIRWWKFSISFFPVHLEDCPSAQVRLEDAFFHVIPLPLKARRFVLDAFSPEEIADERGPYQGDPTKRFVKSRRNNRCVSMARFLFRPVYDSSRRDRIKCSR